MKNFIYVIILGFVVTISTIAWGEEALTPVVTHDAYFDVATGHKYIKNQDNTYTEFSKKGKLLRKDVPNNHSLLVSGKYIRPMDPCCYLVYEKAGGNRMERKILQASMGHPKEWRCQELLLSVKENKRKKNLGLGYSKGPSTIRLLGKKVIATGDAYYDAATNHTYFKNSNDTYVEFSKKRKILRNEVPNDLSLLTSSRYVFDLNPTDYIVYEKRQDGKSRQQILPLSSGHPSGWLTKDVLISVK